MAVPQHMQALELANRVRLKRAALYKDLKYGKITFKEILEHPMVQTADIHQVLMQMDRWGKARASRLLTKHRIRENKKVGTLSLRQKTALLVELSK